MAYDVNATGVFANRPNHDLWLYFRRDLTDAPNNRSSYAWSLYARRLSGAISWTGASSPWQVYIGGQPFSGSSALDFRSTDIIHLGTGGTGWFTHDANGYLNVWGEAHMQADLFGNADAGATLYSDQIAQVPAAPRVTGVDAGIDMIETTSARFRFWNNGDGGSPVTSWAIQYARSLDFSLDPVLIGSSGTSILSPLLPGGRYWARARGQNAVGVGPWSSAVEFVTKSGAFVGDAGGFPGAEVLVGVGGQFVVAETLVGKGGVFVAAG